MWKQLLAIELTFLRAKKLLAQSLATLYSDSIVRKAVSCVVLCSSRRCSNPLVQKRLAVLQHREERNRYEINRALVVGAHFDFRRVQGFAERRDQLAVLAVGSLASGGRPLRQACGQLMIRNFLSRGPLGDQREGASITLGRGQDLLVVKMLPCCDIQGCILNVVVGKSSDLEPSLVGAVMSTEE